MEPLVKNYNHVKLELPDDIRSAVVKEWYANHKIRFYDIDQSRERMSPALAKTRSYHLRAPVIDPEKVVKTESTKDIIDCENTKLYDVFPMIHRMIEWLGNQHGGWRILGRVFISRLCENARIAEHTDEGLYFDTLHRHHFVLRSGGSTFHWQDDEAILREHELWRVNNSLNHWVENSDQARTHIIFDAV